LSITTFVDESKVGGFTLAASSVACRDITRLRGVVDSLRLPRQARLHMVTESAPRRKTIISSLVEAGGISTVIYDARGIPDDKEGHDAAVTAMAADQTAIGATRIVMEADDSVVDAERVMIRGQLTRAGVDDVVGVDHMKAREETLLALPDAIAWCYVKGGEWMTLAAPLIAYVVTL
jgi:hypothetical protein